MFSVTYPALVRVRVEDGRAVELTYSPSAAQPGMDRGGVVACDQCGLAPGVPDSLGVVDVGAAVSLCADAFVAGSGTGLAVTPSLESDLPRSRCARTDETVLGPTDRLSPGLLDLPSWVTPQHR